MPVSLEKHCSFCGKSSSEIERFVAGPGGVRICNECVEACRLILQGRSTAKLNFDPEGWPTERLLALLAPIDATVEAQRANLSQVVQTLRARDVSWARIAKPLGVSRQTAWERFS